MIDPIVAHAFVGAAVVLLIAAAITDLVSLTIPNWIVLSLLTLYLVFRSLDFDPNAIATDAGAAAIVFLVCFVCFSVGWLGGGDAKLAPAVALWVGLDGLMSFLVLTTIAGGVLALVLLAARRGLRLLKLRNDSKTGDLIPALALNAPVPYGIAISVAGITTMFV